MKGLSLRNITVILILLLFIMMIIPVSSDFIFFEDNVFDNNYNFSKTNIQLDEQMEYYVMGYIPESPKNEISPKPEVCLSNVSEFSWMNYNNEDWTTPAKNQGPCGSCWAFGAVSCLEGIINIAWNDPNLDVDLSEQYILSCLSSAGSCQGGNSYTAFKFIKRNDSSGNDCNGITKEECLLYEADDQVPCEDKSSDWKQNLVPIKDYGYWRPTYPDDVDAIKTELMTRGPLVTYFLATGSFGQWGGSHHSSDDYYPYEKADGANHAVIIVGFKDDPSIGNGGYWICKNSWGTNWGYNGFFNIEYGSLNIDNVEITWVEYEPIPNIDFSFSPVNPKIDENIYFDDLSTCLKGDIVEWVWDFGDGETSVEKSNVKSYSEKGVNKVKLTVTDSYGHSCSISKPIYVGDDIPPNTEHTIYGTIGENGWYTSHIGIRLKATDVFSGVGCTMYRLDRGTYQKYLKPLTIMGKSNQGVHKLDYYSIDNSGNIENEKSCTFKIDLSDPKIKILKPENNTLYFYNIPIDKNQNETIFIGPLIPRFEISDDASGIDQVEFYLNNIRIDVDYFKPYLCVINNFHIGQVCELKVRAYDKSGRVTSSEVIYFKQESIVFLRNIHLIRAACDRPHAPAGQGSVNPR